MRVGDLEGLEGRAAVLSVQVVFGKGWTDVLMPVNPLTADLCVLAAFSLIGGTADDVCASYGVWLSPDVDRACCLTRLRGDGQRRPRVVIQPSQLSDLSYSTI
ncbi:uncharacterized protein LAESUDRAFT_765527 [Laetiporus sulphureus 93-53]|uniref:Uncharacterized protein n=1 Tax=Laetiporus sulphureus 93-53 TaxID=1314785 RepID=A0A165AQ87_9APHY|nr:uncharacterized protein LAESUDRAFT_765527 [Laetiporus sulphureus 93-53]KZS99443.1 hypothetical protein LAESUDRAFT_765527 [Laetiporus sulphureus 93-53]